MASRVELGKNKIKELKEVCETIYRAHGNRISNINKYEDIYQMNWDYEAEEGDWVQPLPSPDPHIAGKGMARLIMGSEPTLKVRSDADDVTFNERVEGICRSLLRSADRRGPWITMYDLAMSAIIAGECYVKVVNVEDNMAFLKSRGSEGLARRYERLKEEKPFIFKVYNAKQVFPEYSDLGLEYVVVRQIRPASQVAAFWGEDAVKGAKFTSDGYGNQNNVVYWEYQGHDYRLIYIEGAESPILARANKLDFIPWAGSIIEGSSLFEEIEDQRLPLYYPTLKSGYWHAQSYADSLVYSLSMNLGKFPQLKLKLNNPKQDISEILDWRNLMGAIKLHVSEEAEMFEKKVLDDSIQIASGLADKRMNDMLIPKQVLGAEPENVLAFSSLNMLVQAGRLPLIPVQRMLGVIMSRMFEIPFQWAKSTGRAYPIPSYDEPLEINPEEYGSVFIEVNIRGQFAQDDAQRVAVAANAMSGELWSQDRAMEYTGVEEPLKERAKIEDDMKRRSKMMAALQAEAQKLAMVAQSASMLATGGQVGQMTPQQVQYRQGEDALMLCGNCAFFRGPGMPCQVVAAAIDPFYTCNEWQPAEAMAQALQQQMQQVNQQGMQPPGMQPPGPEPGNMPSMTDPNTLQGGGGIPPITDGSAQTFEQVTGRDRGGNPIAGGGGLPL